MKKARGYIEKMKSVGLFDSVRERKSQVFSAFLSLCGSAGIIFFLKIGTDVGNYHNIFANYFLFFVFVFIC